jgi:hypothetical protein
MIRSSVVNEASGDSLKFYKGLVESIATLTYLDFVWLGLRRLRL